MVSSQVAVVPKPAPEELVQREGRPLVVICGPTATGKTTAAVELAERITSEIIAADSRTVYAGMDIGTAKPTPALQARVRHHLIDVARPDQVMTVAAYRRLALAAMEDIRVRDRVPLLVGGTGLYIRAITDGLTIPEVPPDWSLRECLEQLERHAPGTLHARLMTIDPISASRIHPKNIRRLIRALEVYEHTGQPISELQRTIKLAAPTVLIGLTMDREALNRRIETRVRVQIEAGLVDEVRRLLDAGYARDLPAMQGLGYKEIIAYIDGQVSLDEATKILTRNTRRYAKRQLTWFRRDSRISWISVDNMHAEEVAEQIQSMLH